MNKRLLCVEDANSIIKHFGKGFIDYYRINTSLLPILDSYFAYDFIGISRVTGSISFSIVNELWTGGYRVIDANISNYTVSVDDNTITVAGTGLEWVILELELSSDFKHEDIFELDYTVEYTPVIRPFFEDIALTMGFLDGETPVSGMSVTDVITGETLTTDNEGLVTVVPAIDKAGNYDYILEAENNGVTVDYHFPYVRIPVELPVRLMNYNIYKNKVNTLDFEFMFDDDYVITEDMLFENNHIRLKVNGKYYELVDFSTNHFSFEIPVSNIDKISMSLEIAGNGYVDNSIIDFSKDTTYEVVYSDVGLKSALESENPASTIIFAGNTINIPIDINNSVTLIFDNEVCASALDSVFSVDDGAVFTVSNANFTGKNFIKIDDGSVALTNCSFNHCTSTIVVGTGDLTVDTCSFVDNNACIDVEGDVKAINTLFDLSDNDYLDNSNVPFLDVYGNLNIDYCTFELDLAGLDSLGYSYVICKLGEEYSTNGVENRTLFENEKFPTRNNKCSINVENIEYHITSKSSNCMTWNMINTNTVYSKSLKVDKNV